MFLNSIWIWNIEYSRGTELFNFVSTQLSQNVGFSVGMSDIKFLLISDMSIASTHSDSDFNRYNITNFDLQMWPKKSGDPQFRHNWITLGSTFRLSNQETGATERPRHEHKDIRMLKTRLLDLDPNCVEVYCLTAFGSLISSAHSGNGWMGE